MRKLFLFLFISIITMSNMNSQEKENTVKIITDYGNIKLKLYNDTPQHRDNFLKLVNDGFYKDLLFHRVINNFMIQGGDSSSRSASDTVKLGSNDLDYRIPAEIIYPQHFHKKGALAAARVGNATNPNRESSSTQFYIVTGKKYSDKELNKIENNKIEKSQQAAYNALQVENKDKIKEYYSRGDVDGLAVFRQGLYTKAADEAAKENPVFTNQQREAYKNIGGTPELDEEYTIFGEVIEGLDVLDKIQKVKTDKNERPIENVKMDIVVVE